MGSGRNGMPKAVLAHASGSTAELYLHGAHLTSWTTSDGDEMLFVSEHSAFASDREIRGGVPVIFPQFGSGPLPHHGFARVQEWTMSESGVDERGAAFARLQLRDTPATRSLWPHSFLAEVVVRLAESLEVEFAGTNTGDDPFEFTAALHSYFRVARIRDTRIEGLHGVRYRDKTRGGIEQTDTEDAIGIGAETDRVYLAAPATIRIRDGGNGRSVTVRKRGFADVVVWNPWIRWSREHDDFGDDEYLGMVCVETAQVGNPVRLAPGERWSGAQTLSYGALP